MTDIIVRIPEGQTTHFYCDKMESQLAFWRLSAKPKRLEPDDFIWFSRPGGVVAGARVREVTDRALESSDPQGRWKVTWQGNSTHVFDPRETPAGVQYAGRGFRYLKPDEQERLRSAVESSTTEGM